MKAEYINPFISSITTVFATMLNCELTRGKIYLKSETSPEHEISGIIGLSGKAAGTVVLSLNHNTAISAAEALLGATADGNQRRRQRRRGRIGQHGGRWREGAA